MKKELILEKLSEFSCESLKEMIDLYAKHISIDEQTEKNENKFFILPKHVEDELKNNGFKKNNTEIIKKLPTVFTKPDLYGKELVSRANTIWKENICGLENVFTAIVPHLLEYSNTMHTNPILMVGEPGCGKTTVAKLYARMLGLKQHFINAPRCIRGRGLSGESGSFQNASYGELVEGVLTTHSPNPVFIIDEIDKLKTFHGHGGEVADEMLALLDRSASEFKDNYLGLTLNFSFSPFILTANYIDEISPPLIDRCDVIHFPTNEKEGIFNILENIVVPRELNRYNNMVAINNEILKKMVDTLYKMGVTGIRAYERTIVKMINLGIMEGLEQEEVYNITERELKTALSDINDRKCITIGFAG